MNVWLIGGGLYLAFLLFALLLGRIAASADTAAEDADRYPRPSIEPSEYEELVEYGTTTGELAVGVFASAGAAKAHQNKLPRRARKELRRPRQVPATEPSSTSHSLDAS